MVATQLQYTYILLIYTDQLWMIFLKFVCLQVPALIQSSRHSSITSKYYLPKANITVLGIRMNTDLPHAHQQYIQVPTYLVLLAMLTLNKTCDTLCWPCKDRK